MQREMAKVEIRLINEYQDRALRETADLPFDWAVVRAAGIRINCHALMPNA
jgi:hypothetical protein